MTNFQITVTLDGRDNLTDDLQRVNTQLGQTTNKARGAANQTGRMSTSMGNLRGGLSQATQLMGQFGIALGAAGIVRAVVDLNELGVELRAVETTFNQLTGGAVQAAESLQRMRNRTGNVVDDLTLMRGANQLLLTGLASTNEQAEELTELGFRLSAAMGVDAKEGIENLNAALLNNSFARLDTLGISAAAVRERVAELKEEGLDMSEAFAQAVLEEGREKIELLGQAAYSTDTALNRLGARFRNMQLDLADTTAGLVETGARLVELGFIAGDIGIGNVIDLGTGQIDAQELEVRLSAKELTERARGIRNERLPVNFGEDQGIDTQLQFDIEDVARFSRRSPDQFNQISSGSVFTQSVFGSEQALIDQFGIDLEQRDALIEQLSGGRIDNFGDLDEVFQSTLATELDVQLSAVAAVYGEITAEQEEQLRLEQEKAAEIEEGNRLLALGENIRLRNVAAAEAEARAASEEQAIFESLNSSYGEFFANMGEFASVGGVEILSQEDADAIVARADSMQVRFEDLETLAEDTDFQYISESQLEWAEMLAEDAQNIADRAQAAAEALENMSLVDALGATDGGRLAELTDLILADVENTSIASELELELDLRSGRTTELKEHVENEISGLLADIAEEVSVGAAADAAERVNAIMSDPAFFRLSEDEQIAALNQEVGFKRQVQEQTLTTGTGVTLISGFTEEIVPTGEDSDALAALAESTAAVQSGAEGALLAIETMSGFTEADFIALQTPAGAMEALREGAEGALLAYQTLSGFSPEAFASLQTPALGPELPPETEVEDSFARNLNRVNKPILQLMRDGEGGEAGEEAEGGPAELAEHSVLINENLTMASAAMLGISETDTTTMTEPFIEDLETVQGQVDGLQSGLTTMSQTEFRARVPLEIFLDDKTGLSLGKNAAFRTAVRIVLAAAGVQTLTGGSEPPPLQGGGPS